MRLLGEKNTLSLRSKFCAIKMKTFHYVYIDLYISRHSNFKNMPPELLPVHYTEEGKGTLLLN